MPRPKKRKPSKTPSQIAQQKARLRAAGSIKNGPAWPAWPAKGILRAVKQQAQETAGKLGLTGIKWAKEPIKKVAPDQIHHVYWITLDPGIRMEDLDTSRSAPALLLMDSLYRIAQTAKWRPKLDFNGLPRAVHMYGSIRVRGVTRGTYLGKSWSLQNGKGEREGHKLSWSDVASYYTRDVDHILINWQGFLAFQQNKLAGDSSKGEKLDNGDALLVRVRLHIDVPRVTGLQKARAAVSDLEFEQRGRLEKQGRRNPFKPTKKRTRKKGGRPH